jgi:ubiquinone/menaquinone biosynthesis C-methylase UbiE
MTSNEIKKDKHFPLIAHDNPLRRLFNNPHKYSTYVEQDQVVADLGCGPGFFTFPLAKRVGPTGRVYAVDSDKKAIRAVERKAVQQGYRNIETHTSSAANLSFIPDLSVDFVLAGGLLCSMAPQDHAQCIMEIKRILKPGGKAFLQAARGAISYIGDAEWETILEGFRVEQRNYESRTQDRWALVSKLNLAQDQDRSA